MRVTDDATPPDGSGRHRIDHKARWELLRDSAIEAELQTGRREETIGQVRHSLAIRLLRLVAGWLLVLLGLAGLVLPGPGWLIVILGLSLLPYAWAERTIRIIRRRIPGIPEDGRIPTSSWVAMGALVAVSLSVSVWWGMRGDGEGESPVRARPAAAESDRRPAGTSPSGREVVSVSTGDPTRRQLSQVYGAVTATMVGGDGRHVDHAAPCAAIRDGDADVALLVPDEAIACFGGGDPAAVRASASDANVKLYGPLTVAGVDYWPAVRHALVAADDEGVELAIDGVSEEISAGAPVEGTPRTVAATLMRAAGVGP